MCTIASTLVQARLDESPDTALTASRAARSITIVCMVMIRLRVRVVLLWYGTEQAIEMDGRNVNKNKICTLLCSANTQLPPVTIRDAFLSLLAGFRVSYKTTWFCRTCTCGED